MMDPSWAPAGWSHALLPWIFVKKKKIIKKIK
jgi:hypothetical protein